MTTEISPSFVLTQIANDLVRQKILNLIRERTVLPRGIFEYRGVGGHREQSSLLITMIFYNARSDSRLRVSIKVTSIGDEMSLKLRSVLNSDPREIRAFFVFEPSG